MDGAHAAAAGDKLAAGTLRTLARRQGRNVVPSTEEQPGKILHEVRAETQEIDDGTRLPAQYYGTIDATPLWICLLHDAWRWGMPSTEVAALLPHLEAALNWLVEYGDPDGDGLLEYIDSTGTGLANQGWKDSGDSVRFRDGSLATAPIALCEVQAYAYEAAVAGAELLDAFDRPGADRYRAWATRLQEAFRRTFWVSDQHGPYVAIALDADKRPVDAVTSGMGHLLGTGLLNPEEEATLAERLLSPLWPTRSVCAPTRRATAATTRSVTTSAASGRTTPPSPCRDSPAPDSRTTPGASPRT